MKKRISAKAVRTVARAICRVVTNDHCVGDDITAKPCSNENCRMLKIARAAIKDARKA